MRNRYFGVGSGRAADPVVVEARQAGEWRGEDTASVSHDDFVADFSKWMDDGAPYPTE